MDERIKGRKNIPTDEVDPKNFVSDERVKEMVSTKPISIDKIELLLEHELLQLKK